mmetsp:Transcript_3657/g.13136  ORF Transcript_3657/g.13136 Transcript_3657/m.13136 type:complete len:117 (-) Transcript_3657:1925-2275(-)
MRCNNVVTLAAPGAEALLGGRWVGARVCLGHQCAAAGRTLRITFDRAALSLTGLPLNLPTLRAPELPSSLLEGTAALRSGSFDVTYLSAHVRITRGDRQELRVYVRASDELVEEPE